MNFLNPAVLFGLFAISIPILIHLLNLRKIRRVEFSTLMFLKEMQKSKMRRIKLKQILLLLLRIMSIVFLVLCFSKPVYEGYAGVHDNSNSSTVLIFIDDSFSMAARDNNGQYLSYAKDAVKKILDVHKESDEMYLIPTSKIRFKNNKVLFDSKKEILDSLEKIKLAYKPADMNEIMNYSGQIIKDSKNVNKEVFIISDFQQSNFDINNDANDSKPALYNSAKTYLIKTGTREVNNLSLDSFIVVSKIIEKDKDIKVKIYLTNHSQYNVVNKTINLYVDNILRGEKVVDVASFSKKEVEFLFKSSKAGNVSGVLELIQSEFQDDEIIQDNKYFFSLYIPDKFNIGLISDNPKDSYYINLAIQTAGAILSDSIKRKSELFNVTSGVVIDRDIFKNNVTFISNKKSFTDNEASIVKDYISNGGGVFLFPGNAVDINNYNSTILNRLNTARIENLNADKSVNQNLKFDKIDFENPVLSEIFQNQKLNYTSDYNIESPKINSYYQLLPDENSKSIITLINNKPFLLETKLAKGKIIISSVSATDDFSDLPLKSIFVPLIIRSIYYLSNNFELQKEYIVGKSNLISPREINNISELVLPDKSFMKLNTNLNPPGDNYLFLPYENYTSDIGIYTIQDSAGNKFDFALNNNSAESIPVYLNSDQITEYFKNRGIDGVKFVEQNQDISETIKENNTGFSLWKYFLIGAVFFIIGELVLSKKIEDG